MDSSLRVHVTHDMEQVDILVGEEAHMDLKSAFVPAIPRRPFLRLLFGDPKQSPGGVADNLREHRALLLKAPIGLLAAHRWFMPHELPAMDHHDPREAARADPPPESTRAVYLQIESWLPVKEEEQDNILVLTTRKESAHSLRSFCHQSRRNTNVETAVKVAGATAQHCIVLHGQSSFLSGHSNRSDFDKECYTRANVALSRATDLTVLACPLNMHGLEGATQVIAALLHGACTLHTSNTAPSVARGPLR